MPIHLNWGTRSGEERTRETATARLGESLAVCCLVHEARAQPSFSSAAPSTKRLSAARQFSLTSIGVTPDLTDLTRTHRLQTSDSCRTTCLQNMAKQNRTQYHRQPLHSLPLSVCMSCTSKLDVFLRWGADTCALSTTCFWELCDAVPGNSFEPWACFPCWRCRSGSRPGKARDVMAQDLRRLTSAKKDQPLCTVPWGVVLGTVAAKPHDP